MICSYTVIQDIKKKRKADLCMGQKIQRKKARRTTGGRVMSQALHTLNIWRVLKSVSEHCWNLYKSFTFDFIFQVYVILLI